MIYAIGHDIVENQRMAEIFNKFGDKLVRRFLTPLELVEFNRRKEKIKFLAKRFAAKEAFAKACGTGLRAPVLLSNISVLNDKLGKPYFLLNQELAMWLQQKGILQWHLSLSDERNLTSAVVVFEK